MRNKLRQKFSSFMQNKCAYIIYLTSEKKLIKGNSIPPFRAGPLARVHMAPRRTGSLPINTVFVGVS